MIKPKSKYIKRRGAMLYRHSIRRFRRYREREWSIAQWTKIARWFDDGVYWIRHRDHDWNENTTKEEKD